MLITANAEVRKEMKEKRVPAWAIACEMGVCENTILRRLRTELAPNDKSNMLNIIARLAEHCTKENGGAENER